MTVTSPAPGRIVVDHTCAYFNCCSTLVPEIVFAPPVTLTIIEHEEDPLCYCMGYFNARYEIDGLAPGTWTVRITTFSESVAVE